MAACLEKTPDLPAEPAVATSVGSGHQFYPSSNGIACLSDGNQPVWMTVGQMFDTEEVSLKCRTPFTDLMQPIHSQTFIERIVAVTTFQIRIVWGQSLN